MIARSFAHSSPGCEPIGVILTFCASAGNAASKRANAAQAIFTVPPETFHSRLAGRRATAAVCDCSRSVVKLGSDLALNPRSVIVLDPQLRVILFHEFFDHLAALRGLLLVGVEGRNFLQRRNRRDLGNDRITYSFGSVSDAAILSKTLLKVPDWVKLEALCYSENDVDVSSWKNLSMLGATVR